MTWAMAAQLAGAFFGGAWWMYRRQRRQIRLIAAENRRLARAAADMLDDLFDHLLHDDPDDDLDTVPARPPAGYWPEMN